MIYLKLTLLAAIVVYIVDISGAIDCIKRGLSRWLNTHIRRLKPFDCSLCMTWWAGLAYIVIDGQFSIFTLTWVALLSAMSLAIANFIRTMQDVFDALFTYIGRLINRE